MHNSHKEALQNVKKYGNSNKYSTQQWNSLGYICLNLAMQVRKFGLGKQFLLHLLLHESQVPSCGVPPEVSS